MSELTFENFDKLNRKPFADRLTTVISKFYPFYDSAFVLSLDAKFGSGKTTFLEMWKNDLITQGYKVIEINAWETDFDVEPLIAIISTLLDNLSKKKKVKNALSKALGAAALVGDKYLETKCGLTINELSKAIETHDLQRIGQELYEQHGFKKEAYAELKKILTEAIENLEKKPLIILVDELDRVRPTYAVAFLEAIKHIFSVQGICFVLAVDRDQLKASIKQLYGDIVFDEYYRRFVTREARLAEAYTFDLSSYIAQKYDEFFNKKSGNVIKFLMKETDKDTILEYIGVISRINNFTPRQISHFFRMFLQHMTINTDKTMLLSHVKAIIFLIGLSIKDSDFYHKLGKGNSNGENLIKYLQSLDFSSLPNTQPWSKTILYEIMPFSIGHSHQSDLNKTVRILMNILNVQEEHEMQRFLSTTLYGNRGIQGIPDKPLFWDMYKKLENWAEFIN